jgi:hypothetical protein
MNGSCWRLLAAFSLIFVSSTLLRGQDGAADRASVLAPNEGLLRHSMPTAPVWIPQPSGLPGRYPVGRYPVAPVTIAFQQIVRAAGIIFSGRVISVGHAATSSGQAPASTTVTFQVERAMRGTSSGQNLTIQEWGGLWSSGERYRVGERVLLFLYSPGKLGLTSPVAGGMGRFAVQSQGKIVISPRHAATLSADPILGGKTTVSYADFALAVRRSSREE